MKIFNEKHLLRLFTCIQRMMTPNNHTHANKKETVIAKL